MAREATVWLCVQDRDFDPEIREQPGRNKTGYPVRAVEDDLEISFPNRYSVHSVFYRLRVSQICLGVALDRSDGLPIDLAEAFPEIDLLDIQLLGEVKFRAVRIDRLDAVELRRIV